MYLRQCLFASLRKAASSAFVGDADYIIVETCGLMHPVAEERIVPSLVTTTSLGADAGLTFEGHTDDVPTRFFVPPPQRAVLSEAKFSIGALPRRAGRGCRAGRRRLRHARCCGISRAHEKGAVGGSQNSASPMAPVLDG